MASGLNICTLCADARAERRCPKHPDEIVLSLDDPAVIEELGRLDVEAWEKLEHKYELMGFGVGFLMGLVPAVLVFFGTMWLAGAIMAALNVLIVPGLRLAAIALAPSVIVLLLPAAIGRRRGTRMAANRYTPRFDRWSTAGRDRVQVALKL